MPIVHGSVDDVVTEAKALRRALLRLACFEGWPILRLDTARAGAIIREELADGLGRAAA